VYLSLILYSIFGRKVYPRYLLITGVKTPELPSSEPPGERCC
jgi:hypothetical protein